MRLRDNALGRRKFDQSEIGQLLHDGIDLFSRMAQIQDGSHFISASKREGISKPLARWCPENRYWTAWGVMDGAIPLNSFGLRISF
jgi:hypothetical protein